MLKIYERLKSVLGDQVAIRDLIVTDATTEKEFTDQLAEAIVSMIFKQWEAAASFEEKLRSESIPEAEKMRWGHVIAVAQHDLENLLPNVIELACKLRGYKAERVNEMRMLSCGDFSPGEKECYVGVPMPGRSTKEIEDIIHLGNKK